MNRHTVTVAQVLGVEAQYPLAFDSLERKKLFVVAHDNRVFYRVKVGDEWGEYVDIALAVNAYNSGTAKLP